MQNHDRICEIMALKVPEYARSLLCLERPVWPEEANTFYTCSFVFLGELFFEMLAVTVTAFNVRGINYYSIQFEQVKCTFSGSYTVTLLHFWGSNVAIQAGIVT